jgi:hypothetical protein
LLYCNYSATLPNACPEMNTSFGVLESLSLLLPSREARTGGQIHNGEVAYHKYALELAKKSGARLFLSIIFVFFV